LLEEFTFVPAVAAFGELHAGGRPVETPLRENLHA
jgi:hypothetical protein